MTTATPAEALRRVAPVQGPHMVWLAVHLPWLSLEAWLATLPAAQRLQPAVLVAAHRVQAVNRAAAEGDVRVGLKLATAQALVADLQAGQADVRRDAQALQAVVHGALAFTPSVCTEGHTVLMEVAASLRYFGGLSALQNRLCETLDPLGHHLRLAVAPTALGAVLLARWRGDPAAVEAEPDRRPQALSLPALQGLLDDAPVRLLTAGCEHAEALGTMGLHRFSDLLRLPRAGLARRFGATLLDELDRARGLSPDPRTWLVAPATFGDRLELAFHAEHAEPLLQAAAVLLARLVAWARARQTRVLAFTLVLVHESRHRGDRGDGQPATTPLRIALAEPSADVRHLQVLLHERLARLPLPAPVPELHLHCDEHRPQPPPNGELFPTPGSRRSGWVQLIEQLRARLGDGQVQRLQAVADHRPERATQLRPALEPAARAAADGGLPGLPGLPFAGLAHPAWLLPQALPLAERDALPLLGGHPLVLLAGPERIESGWWDGEPALRDYFIAQTQGGALAWVYRVRLPAAVAGPAWFLQGWFA